MSDDTQTAPAPAADAQNNTPKPSPDDVSKDPNRSEPLSLVTSGSTVQASAPQRSSAGAKHDTLTCSPIDMEFGSELSEISNRDEKAQAATDILPSPVNGTRTAQTSHKPAFPLPTRQGSTTNMSDQAKSPIAPNSWLRPKSTQVESNKMPMTTASLAPCAVATPLPAPKTENEALDLVHTMVQGSLLIIDKQKLIKEVNSIRERKFEDFQRFLGQEEAIKQAANHPEIVAETKLAEQLRAELAEDHDTRQIAARKVINFISNRGEEESKKVLKIAQHQASLQDENKILKERNEKLETRLDRVESLLEKLVNEKAGDRLKVLESDSIKQKESINDVLSDREVDQRRLQQCEQRNEDIIKDTQYVQNLVNVHGNKIQEIGQQPPAGVQEQDLTAVSAMLGSKVEDQAKILGTLKADLDSEKSTRQTAMTELARLTLLIKETAQKQKTDSENLTDALQAVSKSQISAINTLTKKMANFNPQYLPSLPREPIRTNSLPSSINPATHSMSSLQHASRLHSQYPADHVLQGHLHSPAVTSSEPSTPATDANRNAQRPGDSAQTVLPSSIFETPAQSTTSPTARSGPAATVSEIASRIASLEHFVGTHEHRLNYTTLDAIWPSMVRHVMDHISQTYRYPEAIAHELTEFQARLQEHGRILVKLELAQAKLSSNPVLDSPGDLYARLDSVKSELEGLKQAKETGTQQAIEQALEKESERLRTAMREFSEQVTTDINKIKEEQSSNVVTLSSPKPAHITAQRSSDIVELLNTNMKLLGGLETVRSDFLNLETFCYQEISSMNGKIAGVITMQQNQAASDVIHLLTPTEQGPPAKSSKTRFSEQTEDMLGSDGSEEDFVIASSRKRKRHK